MIGFLLLFVSLLFLLSASYTDIKTREVPDELSLAYIIVALFLRLGHSILSGDPAFFTEPLLVALLFFIFSYVFFFFKQWGGGDLLIFTGIGIAFGTLPKDLAIFFSPIRAAWPFWATILSNLFLVGAVYGVAALAVIAIKRKEIRSACARELKRLSPYLLIILASAFFLRETIPLLFFILLLSIIILIRVAGLVEKSAFVKKVSYSALREEDWIEEPVVVDGKIIVPITKPCLGKEDIDEINRLVREGKLEGGIKIKEGIPFIPVFPLTLATSVIIGDLISGMVMAALFSIA